MKRDFYLDVYTILNRIQLTTFFFEFQIQRKKNSKYKQKSLKFKEKSLKFKE